MQFGDKEIEEIRRADLTDFLFNVRLKDDGTEKNMGTINSSGGVEKRFRLESLCVRF